MTKTVSSFSATALALSVLFQAGAAEATSLRTWVSGVGSDANLCTRALPCATFNRAYAVTSAGGEIDVLDGGDFGQLIIGHALTVANDGAGTAAITPPDSNAAGVFVAAGPTDTVVLRGLTLNGSLSDNDGIGFFTGGSLLIDHCKIQGFLAPGIGFNPVNYTAKLWVTDTVLSNNGGAGGGESVSVAPGTGIAATAHFERVQILHGIGNGIRVDGTQGAGAIAVELHDVTVDGSTGGSGIVAVSANSGGAAVNLIADNVTASNNAGYGVRAVGGTASVFLSRSTIVDNGAGVGASSGGVLASYSDNRFARNVVDGSPTTTIPLK